MVLEFERNEEFSGSGTFIGACNNPNDMKHYFEHILSNGMNIPRTVICELNPLIIPSVYNNDVTEEEFKELSKFLENGIGHILDRNKVLFMKTGTYSGKYNFSRCLVQPSDDLGRKAFELLYDSALAGAGVVPTIVVREYISSDEEEPTIYNGMPLRNEFRAFVDFSKQNILDIIDYWHPSEMVMLVDGHEKCNNPEEVLERAKTVSENPSESYLKQRADDYIVWHNWYYSRDEKLIATQKQKVRDILTNEMDNFMLSGKWSVDFMFVDGEPYFIDMAIAEMSALYNLIEEN